GGNHIDLGTRIPREVVRGRLVCNPRSLNVQRRESPDDLGVTPKEVLREGIRCPRFFK
ncbi:hypothetical protein AVEN_130299-1, partial [Araneus ventricosus]